MNTNNLNLIYTPVPFFCDLLFLDLKLLCCVYYIILGSFYFPSQKNYKDVQRCKCEFGKCGDVWLFRDKVTGDNKSVVYE